VSTQTRLGKKLKRQKRRLKISLKSVNATTTTTTTRRAIRGRSNSNWRTWRLRTTTSSSSAMTTSFETLSQSSSRRKAKPCVWSTSVSNTRKWLPFKRTQRACTTRRWRTWSGVRRWIQSPSGTTRRRWRGRRRGWNSSSASTLRTPGVRKLNNRLHSLRRKRPNGSRSCSTQTKYRVRLAASTKWHSLTISTNFSRWHRKDSQPAKKDEYW